MSATGVFADYSSLAMLAECPRRFYYGVERGLVPTGGAHIALHGGRALHAGLHEWYASGRDIEETVASALDVWGTASPPPTHAHYTAGHVELILRNYAEDRAHESLEPLRLHSSELKREAIVDFAPSVDDDGYVVFAETPLAVQLAPDLVYAGLIDLPVRIGGDLYVIDHKTTGQWLTERWALGYARSYQLKGYIAMLEAVTGERVAGAYINGVYTGKEASDDRTKWSKRTSSRNRLFGPYVFSPAEVDEVRDWARTWLAAGDGFRRNQSVRERSGSAAELAWPQNDRACAYCAYARLCHVGPALREGLARTAFTTRTRTGILLSGADSDD